VGEFTGVRTERLRNRQIYPSRSKLRRPLIGAGKVTAIADAQGSTFNESVLIKSGQVLYRMSQKRIVPGLP
jgi:hypothetical protein